MHTHALPMPTCATLCLPHVSMRTQVFDVDMKPPGNSLGYVEVDANLSVPQPGDNWEQWLPLKGNNKGAEVLVRVAHLSQFSGNQVGNRF